MEEINPTVVIVVVVLALLFLFVLKQRNNNNKERTNERANGRVKGKNLIDPDDLTVLKPEFRQEMTAIIAELERHAARLKEIYEAGDKIYSALPDALQESDKWSEFDSFNSYVDSAVCEIESAIDDIKCAME